MTAAYARKIAKSNRERASRRKARVLAELVKAAELTRVAEYAATRGRTPLTRAETVRAQPWKVRLDARISTCRTCGGWRWDTACRGDCKTVNPIIKESK